MFFFFVFAETSRNFHIIVQRMLPLLPATGNYLELLTTVGGRLWEKKPRKVSAKSFLREHFKWKFGNLWKLLRGKSDGIWKMNKKWRDRSYVMSHNRSFLCLALSLTIILAFDLPFAKHALKWLWPEMCTGPAYGRKTNISALNL